MKRLGEIVYRHYKNSTMAHHLSTSLLAKIFVLVNIVLVASAQDVQIDAEENIVKLTEVDAVHPNVMNKLIREPRARFIGDLEIGSRYSNDRVFTGTYKEYNNGPDVRQTEIRVTLQSGYRINYLQVLNDGNTNAVLCETPYSLGSSQATLKLRISPYSTANLKITAAAY